MPINLKCKCGQNLRLQNDLAGKKIKCKKCGAILLVPGSSSVEKKDSPFLLSPEPISAQDLQEPQVDFFFDKNKGIGWFVKKCPSCAENIKVEAQLCRFCNHRFTPSEVAEAKKQAEDLVRGAARVAQLIDLSKKERRRRIGGWILIVFGSLFQIILVLMFILPTPAKGNTKEQERLAALVCTPTGSVPMLVVGFILLKKARNIRGNIQDLLR